MLSFLENLLEGWREERALQGYSYQVSRSGKRRVVAIDGYRKRGEIDNDWLRTGRWTAQELTGQFKNYNLVSSAR
jgi:hypothetical protein